MDWDPRIQYISSLGQKVYYNHLIITKKEGYYDFFYQLFVGLKFIYNVGLQGVQKNWSILNSHIFLISNCDLFKLTFKLKTMILSLWWYIVSILFLNLFHY